MPFKAVSALGSAALQPISVLSLLWVSKVQFLPDSALPSMDLMDSLSEHLSHGQSQENVNGDVDAGAWRLKIEFRTSPKGSNGGPQERGVQSRRKKDVGKDLGGVVCLH